MKMRETSDSELATLEAIQFRIDKIKRESPVLTPALNRRLSALKLRLPSKPGASIKPAVASILLISKRDLDWNGCKPQQYSA